MEAHSFSDPALFRRAADPLLLEQEDRNNLILGVTGTLVTRPEVYPDFHLWLVDEDGSPAAAAAMTPPHHLILAEPLTETALRPLAEIIADSGADVPGVLGNEPAVSTFVHLWKEIAGETAEKTMSHGVFSIERVEEVPEVNGISRPAELEDVDLLIDWVRDFQAEADPRAPIGRTAVSVRSRLHGDGSQSGFWIWEVDGEAVCISGHGGQTPNGIRIGPVYTPVHHRRQGFATALVAAQSAWLLARGHKFCFLYTDLANPTSNSIYAKIGYRRVAEAGRYLFGEASGR